MFLGTIARAATVFFESKDVMLRAQMAVALLLNAILIVQFALYWNSHPAKESKEQAKTSPVKPMPKPDTKKNK
jgi:cell division protein FtsN